MSSNLKYSIKKHKGKIWVILSIVSALVVAIFSYFLFTRDRDVDDLGFFEDEVKIAEHILTGSEDGLLRLIDVETGEEVSELDLSGDRYVYTVDKDFQTIYSYDGKEVQSYKVNRGKIQEADLITEIELGDIKSFKVSEETIAFISEDRSLITLTHREEDGFSKREIEIPETALSYDVLDKHLLYSTPEHLHLVKPDGEERIYIGDMSPTILTMGDKWLIQNQFGSGLGSNILMFLDNETQLIEEVALTDDGEATLLNFVSDQRKIYTINYVNATEPYHLLTAWYAENDGLRKEQNVTVRIPTDEDGVLYSDHTSVTSNEYLYTHFNDSMRIFDIRSQQKHSSIEVEPYFATPILD